MRKIPRDVQKQLSQSSDNRFQVSAPNLTRMETEKMTNRKKKQVWTKKFRLSKNHILREKSPVVA